MKTTCIFDLDGTLADTIDDLSSAVNRMLTRRNLPEHEIEIYKYIVGTGFRDLVKNALPEGLRDDAYIDKAKAEAFADYAGRCLERTHPYPGVPELLSSLSARGIPMAVLSNKPDELTKKVVAGLFPGTAFAIVRGETPAFPSKPNPASALDSCERLGARPDQVLYLGDSGIDMQTAKAAGFFALGALWGFRNEKELRDNGADALLSRPLDLIQYL